MLKTLSIRNVVLIDSLDIDFSGGLTVLSGETGAGKSILLDSLGLLLGSRSESSLVRTGADKLSITGVFGVRPDNKIYDIAAEYDLEMDGDIIIKRTISADGRGKILFNDQIITLKLLRESDFIIFYNFFYDFVFYDFGCYINIIWRTILITLAKPIWAWPPATARGRFSSRARSSIPSNT